MRFIRWTLLCTVFVAVPVLAADPPGCTTWQQYDGSYYNPSADLGPSDGICIALSNYFNSIGDPLSACSATPYEYNARSNSGRTPRGIRNGCSAPPPPPAGAASGAMSYEKDVGAYVVVVGAVLTFAVGFLGGKLR